MLGFKQVVEAIKLDNTQKKIKYDNPMEGILRLTYSDGLEKWIDINGLIIYTRMPDGSSSGFNPLNLYIKLIKVIKQ